MDTDGKVFVTGGTGFIGTRLVQALVEEGQTVRALSRRADPRPPAGFDWPRGGPLAQAGVELVRGDITDCDSLVRGMRGCSRVFHLAALAKNWSADPGAFFRLNVQGMRNVFDAARRLDVKRLVWTSSILTLGPTRRGQLADETMPRNTQRYFTKYEETKSIAEREAFAYAKEGLPMVIVNPTRVFGPGHLTEGNALAQLIDDYDRGRVPVLLNAGVNVANYVFVDDVVRGLLLAMDRGRVGERYVLGGDNVSLRQFFKLIDEVSGKRHFQVPIFRPTAMAFAWLQKTRARWLGVYPRITPGWVRTYMAEWAATSEKAERELGYRPTPLAEGIRITYEWLQRVREEQACTNPVDRAA